MARQVYSFSTAYYERLLPQLLEHGEPGFHRIKNMHDSLVAFIMEASRVISHCICARLVT